ncbi:10345_t:CDS:2, partial [Scutellospora calospora]
KNDLIKDSEGIFNPKFWNHDNFFKYFGDINVRTHYTNFKDGNNLEFDKEIIQDKSKEELGKTNIKKALDDPELDEEEKTDLKKGGVFNPMRWNESNFKKYFGNIQVPICMTMFKDEIRIINNRTTYENTNYDYILENKIEDALHDPDLDDDEKGDLKKFRKKGIFNLFYWNENNFKKYFDDIDVKTYGIFDE